MELSVAEELIALEYQELLKKNGFEISESESTYEEYGEEQQATTRGRVNLVSMPVSKSTTFDIKGMLCPLLDRERKR